MLFYLILSIIALMMDISRPPFVLLLQFASFLGSGVLNLSSIITGYPIFRVLRTQIEAYSDYFLAYSDFYRAYSDFSYDYSDYFTIPPQFKLSITFICKKTTPSTNQPHKKESTNTKNTPSPESQGCPNQIHITNVTSPQEKRLMAR
jgi:hypothetical protein